MHKLQVPSIFDKNICHESGNIFRLNVIIARWLFLISCFGVFSRQLSFCYIFARLSKVAAGRPINICSVFLWDDLRVFNITVTSLQVLNQMLKHTAVAGFSSPWSFDLDYNVVFKSAECRVVWYLTWASLTVQSLSSISLFVLPFLFNLIHLSSSPVSSPLSFTSVFFWICPSSSASLSFFSLCLSLISHSPSLSPSPSRCWG